MHEILQLKSVSGVVITGDAVNRSNCNTPTSMIHVQGCFMCHPQFWSAYIPCSTQHLDAVQLALEQIDVIRRLVDKYPTHMTLVTTAQGIEEAHAAGLLASLIGVEGGHAIGTSLGVLRMLYQLGARYLTLTHTCNTPWADCSIADEPGHIPHLGGLSRFGTLVVREMNRLGMIVDLSHVSVPTMLDALRISRAPVIFSHSSAHALCNSSRNVPDHVLRLLSIGTWQWPWVHQTAKLDLQNDCTLIAIPTDGTQVQMCFARLELRCRETGQMGPAQRVDSGRPRNVLTADLEDAVLTAVQQAPACRTRDIARATNVSKSVVHHVLHDEGYPPYHYTATQHLLPGALLCRVMFCERSAVAEVIIARLHAAIPTVDIPMQRHMHQTCGKNASLCAEQTLNTYCEAHINHIREVAGVDHVGIGAGYDGINM
uniref:Dipeptidase n=1 Tax=Timema genevievae TaxID=629358 RepID=A0A7R9PGY1_TIMGE|nr:unnamed protein product [Timema genevievae]